MPGERAQEFAAAPIPQLDRGVITPGGERLPIRRKRHRGNPTLMPGECVQELAAAVKASQEACTCALSLRC